MNFFMGSKQSKFYNLIICYTKCYSLKKSFILGNTVEIHQKSVIAQWLAHTKVMPL